MQQKETKQEHTLTDTNTHTYLYTHTRREETPYTHVGPDSLQTKCNDFSKTLHAPTLQPTVCLSFCVCFCQMRDTEITVRRCYSPNSGDARGVNEGNKEERSRTAKNRQGQLLCGHLSSSLTGLKDVQRQLQGQ